MFAPISRFEADVRAGAAPLPRSFGAVELEFVLKDGVSRAHRLFQTGVMRARFPNVARGDAPEAVLINTAGGVTGGDCLLAAVEMGEGTAAVITTQAHEKVYRSAQGDVSIASSLRLQDGARLEWLPQPTILFDGARLTRQTDVEMAADASFLGVEAVIFGRRAMGEVMKSGCLSDGWNIRRGGRLIQADRFTVQNDFETALDKPAVLGGNRAMATVRHVAPDAPGRLEDVRTALGEDAGGASAWNGMLVSRLVAKDGYHLARLLARVLGVLRGRPLPPVWSI